MKTLKSIIRTQIVLRVLGAVTILVAFNVSFSVFEAMRIIEDLRSTIRADVRNLEDFIIGQVLVDNQSAIGDRLELYRSQHPNINLKWNPDSVLVAESFKLNLPNGFHWQIPLRTLGAQKFGAFEISGSYFAFQKALREFGIRSVFLIVITILILGLLIPLVTKFPNRFLIAPLRRTLLLLEAPQASVPSSSSEPEVQEVAEIQSRIRGLLREVELKTREAALTEVASKVAHDIRSPVAAILMTIASQKDLDPEAEEILQSAARRIQTIADGLLKNYRKVSEAPKQTLRSAYSALELEKRKEFAGQLPDLDLKFTIDGQLNERLLNQKGQEWIRITSNLLNNAIEAAASSSLRVRVTVDLENSEIVSRVSDSGRGIPSEVLRRLGNEILTLGKSDKGTGLGLFHARRSLESWGGQLEIKSVEGAGTVVTLRAPLSTITEISG